jgi:hypothetical protein
MQLRGRDVPEKVESDRGDVREFKTITARDRFLLTPATANQYRGRICFLGYTHVMRQAHRYTRTMSDLPYRCNRQQSRPESRKLLGEPTVPVLQTQHSTPHAFRPRHQ